MIGKTEKPPASQQIAFMVHELALMVNHKWWRWLTIWFGSSAGVIISYRLDRFLFLLVGDAWVLGRVFFFPVFLFFRMMSARHGVCYRAEIGRGFQVMNPTLGVVVSGNAVIGEKFTMCGGNSVASRTSTSHGDIVLGDRVYMGVNSVILGPISVGNDITIGAGAVVIDSVGDRAVLVGVPAGEVSGGNRGMCKAGQLTRKDTPVADEIEPEIYRKSVTRYSSDA